jgi:hypothetical protein
MRELVESEEYFNRRLIRNNRMLAGALFFFQTATILFTALAILPSPSLPATRELMVVTGVAVLQLLGKLQLMQVFRWSGQCLAICSGLRLELDCL